MKLDELKKKYAELSKKHNLPEFTELNERFEIDRIERDTDFVLREVRKVLMDKIIGYIKFIEMILNPSQAPPLFLMFVKNMNPEDRKVAEAAYKDFVQLELNALKLEIQYSEKKEAEIIKNIFETWNKNMKNLQFMIDVMEKSWGSGSVVKKEKGYFG